MLVAVRAMVAGRVRLRAMAVRARLRVLVADRARLRAMAPVLAGLGLMYLLTYS